MRSVFVVAGSSRVDPVRSVGHVEEPGRIQAFLLDNRVQIGSCSAIIGKEAENPNHLELLRKGLHRKFPAITDIDLDYSWWGWVDVSHVVKPRIFQPEPDRTV